jgi:hypothetical protein
MNSEKIERMSDENEKLRVNISKFNNRKNILPNAEWYNYVVFE